MLFPDEEIRGYFQAPKSSISGGYLMSVLIIHKGLSWKIGRNMKKKAKKNSKIQDISEIH